MEKLAALLEKYFDVRLNKRFQRADWSARPISPPMLAYAAEDTRSLPALRDLMREALEAVCGHAFSAMGIRRMEAEVNPMNHGSNALLQRVGFSLEGTMRQRLLDEKIIQLREIRSSDIRSFDTFRIINAMLEFESPEIEVSAIVF